MIKVRGDLNDRFFRTVGRHFVTLSCMQTPAGASKEKVLLFSGFIADIRGVWFYVTAGHILRDIRSSLKAGGKFDTWRLGDQTAGNRFKGIAIPFDFDIDRWLVIENEQVGLDYAAVALDATYCHLLKAGEAIPIERKAWGNHISGYDQWILVGVPSESVAHDEKTIITARVAMIPIEQVEEPEIAGPKAQNQFYGRLKEDSPSVVSDIDGMSGGPIFATKRVDQTLKYWVIGVQSGWYPSSLTIAACPFSSLGFALEKLVETVSKGAAPTHCHSQ